MAREKCGLLAVPRTVPVQLTRYRTLRLDQNTQSAKLNQYFITAGFHMPCTVLGTLRTTTALVRVFISSI
jgi:hypothetical protein